MIIRINKRDNPYVLIDKRPLENPALSWKAKGLLVYLLSKPDNWTVRVAQLVKSSADGVDAVRSALQELKLAGHAELRVTGAAGGKEWVVMEKADIGKTPKSENPDVGETPTYSNNDLFSKNEKKTKEGEFAMPSQILSAPESMGILAAWYEFVADRKERKSPLTTRAANAILNRLAEQPTRAKEVLELMIERRWKSFRWEWLDKPKVSMSIPQQNGTGMLSGARRMELQRQRAL